MQPPELQVIMSFLSGFGAGVIGAYIGVRVALAEMKTKQIEMGKDVDDHAERIKYLERRTHG